MHTAVSSHMRTALPASLCYLGPVVIPLRQCIISYGFAVCCAYDKYHTIRVLARSFLSIDQPSPRARKRPQLCMLEISTAIVARVQTTPCFTVNVTGNIDLTGGASSDIRARSGCTVFVKSLLVQ